MTKLCDWLNKLFGCTTPPVLPPNKVKKTALLFAINDYAGDANDLNGCINDQEILIDYFMENHPEFIVTGFTDSRVTIARFVSELDSAVSTLKTGDVLFVHYSGHGTQVYDVSGDESDGYDEALYLYDGPLKDDDINAILRKVPEDATVVLAFDSCFSGSATRLKSKSKTKIRFHQLPNHPIRRRVRRRFVRDNMKWLAFSGCGEQEYSYDAYIDGQYNGAFTYYAVKELAPDITYQAWHALICKHLPSSKYPQSPELEGEIGLFDKQIFV